MILLSGLAEKPASPGHCNWSSNEPVELKAAWSTLIPGHDPDLVGEPKQGSSVTCGFKARGSNATTEKHFE